MWCFAKEPDTQTQMLHKSCLCENAKRDKSTKTESRLVVAEAEVSGMTSGEGGRGGGGGDTWDSSFLREFGKMVGIPLSKATSREVYIFRMDRP